jgi:hypothetical protein
MFTLKGGPLKLCLLTFWEASLRSALPLRGLPAPQGDGLHSATRPPPGPCLWGTPETCSKNGGRSYIITPQF